MKMVQATYKSIAQELQHAAATVCTCWACLRQWPCRALYGKAREGRN